MQEWPRQPGHYRPEGEGTPSPEKFKQEKKQSERKQLEKDLLEKMEKAAPLEKAMAAARKKAREELEKTVIREGPEEVDLGETVDLTPEQAEKFRKDKRPAKKFRKSAESAQ